MCGIFGFISTTGEGPEISRLRRIALVTQSRGEHAFGLAWINQSGRMQTFKQPGSARDHLHELEHCRNAVILIGHCRYATHGSPLDNRNNHPHVAGSGYLVHNGVIHNYHQLLEQFACSVQSQCDSEVLGLLMARCPGSLLQRAAWTAVQAEGDLAILGIWRKPARLLICRRGRPLNFGQNGHGYYFASLPDGLPPGARAVTDHSACVMTVASTGVYWDRMAVRSHDAQSHIAPGRNPCKKLQMFPNLPFPFGQKQRNDMV